MFESCHIQMQNIVPFCLGKLTIYNFQTSPITQNLTIPQALPLTLNTQVLPIT